MVSADEAVGATGNAAPLVHKNAFVKWLNHSPLKPTHSSQLSGCTVISANESWNEHFLIEGASAELSRNRFENVDSTK
jgi:hypothetical protein